MHCVPLRSSEAPTLQKSKPSGLSRLNDTFLAQGQALLLDFRPDLTATSWVKKQRQLWDECLRTFCYYWKLSTAAWFVVLVPNSHKLQVSLRDHLLKDFPETT